jgi:hypothetical protein
MYSLWPNGADLARQRSLGGDAEADGAFVGTSRTSLAGLRGKIVTAAMS